MIRSYGESIFNGGNVGIGTTSTGGRRIKIVGSSSHYPLSLDSTDSDYQLEFTKNGTSEWCIKASASSKGYSRDPTPPLEPKTHKTNDIDKTPTFKTG